MEPTLASGALVALGAFVSRGELVQDRIDATSKTLLYVANLSFASGREDEAEMYREIVKAIELGDGEWDCCPVCEESECDSDCPLEPIRRQEN